jgi:hypothetical protein
MKHSTGVPFWTASALRRAKAHLASSYYTDVVTAKLDEDYEIDCECMNLDESEAEEDMCELEMRRIVFQVPTPAADRFVTIAAELRVARGCGNEDITAEIRITYDVFPSRTPSSTWPQLLRLNLTDEMNHSEMGEYGFCTYGSLQSAEEIAAFESLVASGLDRGLSPKPIFKDARKFVMLIVYQALFLCARNELLHFLARGGSGFTRLWMKLCKPVKHHKVQKVNNDRS